MSILIKLIFAGVFATTLVLSPAVSAQTEDVVKFGQLRVPNAFFIGIEKGTFERYGIDAQPVFFRSGAELAAQLIGGHIDAGGTTPGATLFNALAGGTKAKVVGDYAVFGESRSPNWIVIRKDLADSGAVTQISDLKGRTIAITARGQVTHLFIGRLLERGGLSEKDVRLVTLSYPDMLAAFEGKAIAAAPFIEPLGTIADRRGLITHFLDTRELMPELSLLVLVYSERLTTDQRELGHRFMKGWHEANLIFRELDKTAQGRKDAAEIFQKYVPAEDGEIYEEIPYYLGRTDLVVNIEGKNGLRDQFDWYRDQGLIPNPPELNVIVDNEFAFEAQRDAE